jgi:hypothetical protein
VLDALPTDMERVKETRATAIEWRIAQTKRDTDQFATTGYDRAFNLVRENWFLITDLAEMLIESARIDGDTLENWFHAASSSLLENDDNA